MQRAAIREQDGNPEGNFKAPSEVDVAQTLVVNGQSISFGDLPAGFEHVALQALTKPGRQIPGWVFLRHVLIHVLRVSIRILAEAC